MKWVRPKSIHITLKFLGDISISQTDKLADAIQHTVQNTGPFTVSLKGTGAFPNERRPRVFWIGIDQGGLKLGQLAAEINKSLKPLGFTPEKRDFSPHVTIGRIRSLSNINEAIRLMHDLDFAEKTFPVESVEFMKSDLKPTGAEYTVLKQIHL